MPALEYFVHFCMDLSNIHAENNWEWFFISALTHYFDP